MKNLFKTTTNFLETKIQHCGSYAGEFSQEAFDLVNAECDVDILAEEAWSDIMYFPSTGEVIAIVAEGELSSDSDCYYVYLDEKDCPQAFDGMMQKELSL